MAVTYHAGKRIQGTSTDFGTDGAGIPGVSGGWVELGRTTLGSAGDTIDVASLPDKRYYMVLGHSLPTGQARMQFRLNSDTGANYAYRASVDGGADVTAGSAVRIISGYGSTSLPQFTVAYLSNLSSKEKLFMSNTISQGTAGAGNAPNRQENVNKWANTSSVISSIQGSNDLGGDFNTNSEVVVLGYDPDDTHTTNFWEELASVDWSSGSSISSGTISAKKYLWVQAYSKNDSTAGQAVIKFNSDGGTNYADRYSYNSGTDGTDTSNVHGLLDTTSSANDLVFYNMFIVNNSANEKLIINHSVNIGGTGAGNAPNRTENVLKWTNTSSQITDIEFKRSSGNMTAGQIKVWGSN